MRSIRRYDAGLVLPFALGLAATAALAIAPHDGPHDTRALDPAWVDLATVEVAPGEGGALAAMADRFVAVRGGDWSFRFDARTGRPAIVQGSGVPMIPGRGNRLDATALEGLDLPDGDVSAAALEPRARDFIEAHAEMLVPGRGVLELDRGSSVTREGGRLHSVYFKWTVDGVEVERARVFVRLNGGNVTQFGAPLVGGRFGATTPSIDAGTAIDAVLAWGGEEELARVREEPYLLFQPELDGSGAFAYRLVWVVTYDVPRSLASWEGRVDATTGSVVAFRDLNHHARATGGVYPRTVTEEETVVALEQTDVRTEAGTVTTDRAGAFDYQGGGASSGLNGRFFDMSCSDGCSNPGQANAEVSVGAGFVEFGVGGDQQLGNGVSTLAERAAFFHMNRVRRVAKDWLPTFGFLDELVSVNVNIDSSCNASWNNGTRTANFYRKKGDCNNTGEIADVVYHEYGHGLDLNSRGADGATGEGTADVVSLQMTHGSQIGPYFRLSGSPVRDIDPATSPNGFMTRTNVGTKCASGTGAQGYAVHCEGQIWGQTAFDLSQALVQKHGYWTGWRTSERLFFTSLPDAGGYLPTDAFPIYDAYLLADDDDGDLSNGTPNATEIYDAFNAHEIANAPVAASTPCTRPAEVVPTATPSCDTVELAWGGVANAQSYVVLRNEVRQDAPFTVVAELDATATSFVDTQVAPGIDYWYTVQAVAADGCESTIESVVPARLDDQPILSVSAVVADDTPRGNRSGYADPDEEVDLVVTFENLGTLAAEGVSATLTSDTPGVTILEGFDTWSAIAPGAASTNAGVLRFIADGTQVACGEPVRFRLVPDEATGCATDTSFFEVTLGERVTEYSDDFETDQGWSLDLVESTAATGDWTYGDPDGTSFQPENDNTVDPGARCWFTAPNPNGDGGDDVDDGVTVLESPAIDLSGLADARLTYARWFANRDLGEDTGDFFRSEVSSDGGATWTPVEELGTDQSAASWNEVEFDLAALVPLTADMRLRFSVADGIATGNLIEGAIDDVRVESAVCDDTPACFTEPTFGGVESAVPGASCGETNVTWSQATTNCENATIHYNVYRSTDPAFTPSEANRVASGLTGTSFDDTLLEPGVTYHYIVRAFDSRSGEDSNEVVATVVSPSSPDDKAPVFDGLVSAVPGGTCGETVLTWSSALESCNDPVSYEVYRSTDAGFVPGPATRIGSALSTSFVDVAPTPGLAFTYVVRARDGVGNEDANDVRLTVAAAALDETLLDQTFEADAGGFTVVAPNDAATGNWEYGDPEGTEYQPEDDHTEPGLNAWITGLAAAGGGGGNDIDTGTTTLLSPLYDLSTSVDPAVRYFRWFTNDLGGAPGEDPFVVEVSNDDGATWTELERVGAGTPLEWVEREIPLAGVVTPTGQMRFRFTASDLNEGSLVEAGVDDFGIVDRGQGCDGCALPVEPVGTILVDRQGDDVVLDWTGDPVVGTRFAVYKVFGETFSESVRIGTTDGRTFVHEGAALSAESFYYQVTTIDGCGNESGF